MNRAKSSAKKNRLQSSDGSKRQMKPVYAIDSKVNSPSAN